ncbi:bifunctional enoyl-CoA hydratase/phosphate acetyltransferase [Spiribacter pallidus]|uniref:bifunctional enoyl-CoA hydratase/phosphate acetyltransferase n=1 Tax=Spiribacter pallidus TaxID=1987936 RepID=UPI00349F6B0D
MSDGAQAGLIENRTFDELAIGDAAAVDKRLTLEDIKLFAVISGDVNPAHVDEEYARGSRFHEQIAHGMWGGALISSVLGTRLPGPGTIYLGQTLRFHAPVRLGDRVHVTVTVRDKIADKNQVIFACACHNQDDALVLDGEARVLAPTEKIRRPRTLMPTVRLAERGRLHELLANTDYVAPIKTALVHPVEPAPLRAAIEAAETGIIEPVLIGPDERLRQAAADAEVDLGPYACVSVPHSHAAAQKGAAMAASGEVAALIKGALSADELLTALLADNARLRTERIPCEVMAFDVPTYPRPLLIADPRVNVHPDLFAKRDIVLNAVELAHALQVESPRVAMLSSSEAIDPRLTSTLHAAAVCKMADRGQIPRAVVDGPMAFDTAISPATVSARGVVSPVAGQADVLVAPDLESASMLVKQLHHLADARGAGLLLGLRVPVVMSERDDDVPTRLTGIGLLARLALAGS